MTRRLPPSTDARALRILFDTFRPSPGWKQEPPTTPAEDLA